MGVEKETGDVGALGHDGTFPFFTYQSQAMPSTLGARDVPSSQPKVQVTVETWDPWIGPTFIRGEVHEAQWN
jgi:hypothetical protein